MPRNQGTSRKGKPKRQERAAGMGRALTKAQQKRFRPKSNGASRGAGMAMAPDTYDIGFGDQTPTTMLSVLETDDLTDFLGQAEMAGREFSSEREQFIVLDETGQEYKAPQQGPKVSWSDQPKKAPLTDGFAFAELSVPRRPKWDETTTAAELDKREKESFLEWRRAIAAKEEELMSSSDTAGGVGGIDEFGNNNCSVRVTPFEKNLEVWRQLWRVLERCSCILQIVDARNPLFYVSRDLRRYATEELGKPMLLVINKSDYLSAKQRQMWHDYFMASSSSSSSGGWVHHVFFSAHEEQGKLDDAAQQERRRQEETLKTLKMSNFVQKSSEQDGGGEVQARELGSGQGEDNDVPSLSSSRLDQTQRNIGIKSPLTRQQLLDCMEAFAKQHDCQPDPRFSDKIQFGMVGFPNVGKSSVINVLMGTSKHTHGLVRVGVAAQPGKTKHFQTLFLPDREQVMLCDCPGLVFPSFVSSTADLIAAGVYPISQMRDPWPVVSLICQRIPREILNVQYGITIPISNEPSSSSSTATATTTSGTSLPPPPTAEELLSTFCIARSLLAAGSGIPDYQKASRIVIKDYADGKLLYCHAPPGRTNNERNGFLRETILTALTRTKKLRALMETTSQEMNSEKNSEKEDNKNDIYDDIVHEEADPMLDLEDDLDLLEIMEGGRTGEDTNAGSKNGNKRGKSHKSMRKHGKRGKKERNKDPYGCHSTPDDMLGDAAGSSRLGVVVNAGKYGRRGYTRPSYTGARSAVH